jgi:SnoaL-like domain
MDAELTARLAKVIDNKEIRDVVYRFCRAIDRRDFELMRTCFHADATDDHGSQGSVDDLIAALRVELPIYERTMHFVGNVLVEPLGDQARAESYVVAYRRRAATVGDPARDVVNGVRFVDDFERRRGEWRIVHRVVAFEWTRVDDVPATEWALPAGATLGRPDGDDVVFARHLYGP